MTIRSNLSWKVASTAGVPASASIWMESRAKPGAVAVERDRDQAGAAEHAEFGDLGDQEGDRDGDVLGHVERPDIEADLHPRRGAGAVARRFAVSSVISGFSATPRFSSSSA